MCKVTDAQLDRARGCLLGLALGDALGTTNEFVSKEHVTPITSIVGGGPFKLKAGEWTDDTSMALCLADSFINCHRTDLKDQIERYLGWWKKGENSVTGRCFDIGRTVYSALQQYTETRDPIAGAHHDNSASNGSLMRLAPVAMFYAPWKHIPVLRTVTYAGLSSITTHQEARAVDGCRALSYLLYQFLGNETNTDKQTLLEEIANSELVASLHPAIQQVMRGSYRTKTRDQIVGSSFVVESLESALWCFFHSDDFSSGALLAANLGDDADTTAAIYGQIAGTYYGESGLPAAWLSTLAWRDYIGKLADKLAVIDPLPADSELIAFISTYEQCKAHYSQGEDADKEAFHALLPSAYDNGLVLLGFDWVEWSKGRQALNELAMIDHFDLRECCQLITTLIRSMRISDLSLAQYYDIGALDRIVSALANSLRND